MILRYAVIFTISLFLAVFAGYAWSDESSGTGGSPIEARNRALTQQAELAAGEKELVAELLTWDVKIASARQEQDRLRQQVALAGRSLEAAEAGLEESRARYDEGMAWLGRWVNFLFRCGPAAYLEVILEAATFNGFVERAEIVKIVITSQVKMLDEVRRAAGLMQEQVLACRQHRAELEAKSAALAAALADMEHCRAGREDFLAGLRRQSAELAEKIIEAETSWYRSLDSLHCLLTHLQSLPWQSLSPERIAFTGDSIVVKYSDSEINNKFFNLEGSVISGFSVRSTPGTFHISGPAAAGGPVFSMAGNFIIEGESIVRFEPAGMSIEGVPVSREVISFIASDTLMRVDLRSISRGFGLTDIKLEEGRMVFWFVVN